MLRPLDFVHGQYGLALVLLLVGLWAASASLHGRSLAQALALDDAALTAP